MAVVLGNCSCQQPDSTVTKAVGSATKFTWKQPYMVSKHRKGLCHLAGHCSPVESNPGMAHTAVQPAAKTEQLRNDPTI